jgi:hypothetical protein
MEQIFMAWHYARYVNCVAAAGKAEYPLPMFVNAALIRPNYKPGQYPSAGPLPHLFDIWRAAAPQVDFLSPDIDICVYLPAVLAYSESSCTVTAELPGTADRDCLYFLRILNRLVYGCQNYLFLHHFLKTGAYFFFLKASGRFKNGVFGKNRKKHKKRLDNRRQGW